MLLATLNSRAEMRAAQSGIGGGGHNYSADAPGSEVRWRRQTTRDNTIRSGADATELGTRKVHITTMVNSATDVSARRCVFPGLLMLHVDVQTDPIKDRSVYEDSPV